MSAVDFETYDERDDSWNRVKEYGERWPRYSAEVPPELDVALREAQRRGLGVNYDGYQKRPTTATRANLVRAGLRLYLRLKDPMPEPVQFDIDGTCYEVRVVGELSAPDDPDAVAAERGQRPHYNNEGYEIP